MFQETEIYIANILSSLVFKYDRFPSGNVLVIVHNWKVCTKNLMAMSKCSPKVQLNIALKNVKNCSSHHPARVPSDSKKNSDTIVKISYNLHQQDSLQAKGINGLVFLI